jgi:hypothetical protein
LSQHIPSSCQEFNATVNASPSTMAASADNPVSLPYASEGWQDQGRHAYFLYNSSTGIYGRGSSSVGTELYPFSNRNVIGM